MYVCILFYYFIRTELASQILPRKPRFLADDCSIDNTYEPANCPPTDNPCIILNTTNKIGEIQPSVAYPGKIPMRTDGIVINKILNTKACFRPTMRSPISPNKIAPMGRIKKAAR